MIIKSDWQDLQNNKHFSSLYEHACDKSLKETITDKKNPQSSSKNPQQTQTTTQHRVLNKTEQEIQIWARPTTPKVQ